MTIITSVGILVNGLKSKCLLDEVEGLRLLLNNVYMFVLSEFSFFLSYVIQIRVYKIYIYVYGYNRYLRAYCILQDILAFHCNLHFTLPFCFLVEPYIVTLRFLALFRPIVPITIHLTFHNSLIDFLFFFSFLETDFDLKVKYLTYQLFVMATFIVQLVHL